MGEEKKVHIPSKRTKRTKEEAYQCYKDFAAQFDKEFRKLLEEQIILAFKDGITEEEMHEIASPTGDAYSLETHRLALAYELNEEEEALCNSHDFNFWQLMQIRKGFMYGCSIDAVKIYARPEFDWRQMSQMVLALHGTPITRTPLTPEEVRYYARPEFSWIQMEAIYKGLGHGLSLEEVDFYARPEFPSDIMNTLLTGFLDGLTLDQAAIIAHPELGDEKVLALMRTLLDKKDSEK